MGLQRSLTLFGAVMLVVGNVVGAGIFTTSGILAAHIDHPAAFIFVWVVGGLLTIAGALTYAELGAMFPRAGGDYQFLKEAYSPMAGFIIGWLNFWVISPGSIAALSIAFVGYLPGLPVDNGTLFQKGLAIVVIAILSIVNYRSIRLASGAQSVITMGSLVLLVGLVVGGAASGRGEIGNFSTSPVHLFSFGNVLGPAMIAVLFTYSGWFAAAYVGSEVMRPNRNVPLALLVGTVLVTILYTGVNAAYLYALPLEEMRGATDVAQIAATRLFGSKVAVFVSIAVLLAIGSCVNGTVMTGSRVCYAMAEDGVFWKRLGKVHPRFHTPHVAIVAQAVLASGFVLIGSFGKLLEYVVFAMLLSSMATGIAHLVLRIQHPELPRPYRTVGYPVIPIVFVGTYAWIAVSIAIYSPGTSVLGLGLALTAIPFYLWKKKKT
jgi:APA family basic amino acid/polyamine antiporter